MIKHGYKVTMIDRRPFGEVAIRFLESDGKKMENGMERECSDCVANDFLIEKLRFQIQCMREIIHFLDKTLSALQRRPTPDLPPIVDEQL